VQQPLSLSQLLRQNGLSDSVPEPGFAARSGSQPYSSASGFGSLPLRVSPYQRAGEPAHPDYSEQEWLGGIAALAQLLLKISPEQDFSGPATDRDALWGVVLSGPFPVLPDRLFGKRLSTWLLLPATLDSMLAVARPLLPAKGAGASPACDLNTVPLKDEDPLTQERFCLFLTRKFCLSLVLGPDPMGQNHFQFSFDPTMAEQVWQQLRDRIAQARPPLLPGLDQLIRQFPPVAPDFRLVTEYSHLLMQQMRQRSAAAQASNDGVNDRAQCAGFTPAVRRSFQDQPSFSQGDHRPLNFGSLSDGAHPPDSGTDAELLKAMAHEIRTPLTTIRTFTRSLLKRGDISDAVARRLRMIDQECTQQIDRFNLIFRAVELETDRHQQPRSPLSALSLNHLFEEAIPQWQQQASRRNLTLEVEVPPKLPMVNSDPTMLNQVLTGLIDRFTHSLPPYSHIKLAVTLAGHQLKLQFQSQPPEAERQKQESDGESLLNSPFKALGQLLMFQPETGGLSLNLNVTKNLFQALGGKLIVRQRPQAGEVLTVFLPLETRTL
jgi:signal transduction histidine kinase